MSKLYDISEVCEKLGTTSRTLRFYEEKGLIESTVNYPSNRRRYSEDQLIKIKKVLALRALGLSLKTIVDLERDQISLEKAILMHKVELIRLISEKQRQINLLEEVMHDIQSKEKEEYSACFAIKCTDRQLEIADICTKAVLNKKYKECMRYFSDDMKVLLSETALKRSFEMAVAPIGELISVESYERVEKSPNVIFVLIKYEKAVLRMKYVFHGDIICGLWTDYAE